MSASHAEGAAPPLLERAGELDSLAGLVAAAASGRAGLALIEGPPGIGKSRLLAELRRDAVRSGFRVLDAQGSELEREFPFGVVRQLFEPLMTADRGDHLLAGAAAGARAVFSTQPATPGEPIADASFAAVHGLYWLTTNVAAETPVVLAVDDLHWTDRPSLRFLAYLARRLEGLPVLVAATLRPAEPNADVALLAEIGGRPEAIHVHPRPLSSAAAGELVEDRLGENAAQRFTDACHEATGGNPLLLGQLLTSLAADGVTPDVENADMVRDVGPRAVSRTVLLRLGRLSPRAVAVARAIAVLGDNTDLPTIAELAELEPRQVAEATRALAAADIVSPGPPLGFVHPLVRDAVYDELSPTGERELQHARAADVLRAAGAPAEQIAAHLLLTYRRGEPWVADLLQDAGRLATRQGAPDGAIAYFRRALEEPLPPERRARVLLELGAAEALTDGRAAALHLEQAYDVLEDPSARALAAQLLARTLFFTDDPRRGREVARRAAAELPADQKDARDAVRAFELLANFSRAGDAEALEHLVTRGPPRSDAGTGAKMLAAVAALASAYRGRDAAESTALALGALSGGSLVGATEQFLSTVAIIPLALADREEAVQAWNDSLADAHRRGSVFAVASIHAWLGFTLHRRGELADAEAALQASFDELDLYGFAPGAVTYCAALLAPVLIDKGDVAAARAALQRGEFALEGTDAGRWWAASHVRVLLAEGSADEAADEAAALGRSAGWVANPAVVPWRSMRAQALDRLGRREEAVALARDELDLARQYGAAGTVGRSLRVLGALEREGGAARLAEAVEILGPSPARLEHAKALLAYGAARRRAGERVAARELLREALDLAHRCGATPVAESARQELVAAGAKPRRAAMRGVESLTPSELRVVQLAAQGLTNREIAQTLFVTIRTVQGHLSQAFAKLEIDRREQLADALAG